VSYEPELESDERDALRSVFLSGASDVPQGFADRVAHQAASEHAERVAVASRRVREAAPPSWAAWWIGMVAAAAAIVLALVLMVRDTGDDSDDVALAAERVLLRECTPCHVGEASGAEADALAVFDLRDPRWQDGLSSAQLEMIPARVAERGNAIEIAGVRRFVDAQLARR